MLDIHPLEAEKKFVDRIYVMNAGSIVEEGPTGEVFNGPQHPTTQLLIKAVPNVTGGGIPEGILGQVPSYLNPPAGCRFVTRCPYAMKVCDTDTPPMYEVGANQRAACFLHEERRGAKGGMPYSPGRGGEKNFKRRE